MVSDRDTCTDEGDVREPNQGESKQLVVRARVNAKLARASGGSERPPAQFNYVCPPSILVAPMPLHMVCSNCSPFIW